MLKTEARTSNAFVPTFPPRRIPDIQSSFYSPFGTSSTHTETLRVIASYEVARNLVAVSIEIQSSVTAENSRQALTFSFSKVHSRMLVSITIEIHPFVTAENST